MTFHLLRYANTLTYLLILTEVCPIALYPIHPRISDVDMLAKQSVNNCRYEPRAVDMAASVCFVARAITCRLE